SWDWMGISGQVAGGRLEAMRYERLLLDYKNALQSLNDISAATGIAAGCLLSESCTRLAVAVINAWTTSDFLSHYYGGNGESVNLAEIGLAGLYLSHPSVINLTGAYMNALESVAVHSFWAPQAEIGYTDVTDTIYSLGKSALYAAGGCQGADCFFRFMIRDKFADPIHLRVEIPFGVPYDIVYEWSVLKRRGRW
ncbi:MAG TPA: hypothetical protein VK403_05480, partial [Allosphingosinicella sp.]|nr:hypothetical protein [Allosphingosinicella sp.]